MKQKHINLALAVILMALVLTSCEGPEGPAGPQGGTQIWVTAEVGPEWWAVGNGARVTIENCPVIPSVNINGIPLTYMPGTNVGEVSLSPGNLLFECSNFNIQPGENASLLIEYEDLNGETRTITGDVVTPGQFQIIEPADTTIELVWGEDLSFTWSSAQDASGYLVHFYRSVQYFDLNNELNSFSYTFDNIVSDTTITFPAEILNPDSSDIYNLNNCFGSFYITAFNGPSGINEASNIAGDRRGYFYSYSLGGRVYIDYW